MVTEYFDRAYEFLKFCAKNRLYATYTEFGKIAANGQPRNHGALLDAVNIRCHERGEPLLGVLVVAKGTTLPIITVDWEPRPGLSELIYRNLDVPAEQRKCFAYNWS